MWYYNRMLWVNITGSFCVKMHKTEIKCVSGWLDRTFVRQDEFVLFRSNCVVGGTIVFWMEGTFSVSITLLLSRPSFWTKNKLDTLLSPSNVLRIFTLVAFFCVSLAFAFSLAALKHNTIPFLNYLGVSIDKHISIVLIWYLCKGNF